MTAARGDVLLLGGGYLIPYRPYRGGRTGVVAISPAHEGGNSERARKIDYIEIGQGMQGLLNRYINTTVVKLAREEHGPTASPSVKETGEVAEGWIKRGTKGDFLVEGCCDD